MRSICVLIGVMFSVVLTSGLMAAGKADKKASLSFHIENDINDNPKMIFSYTLGNGQKRYFRRLPEISTKDVVSYSPFPSDTGDGYGAVFRLRDSAGKRYEALTNINQDKLLVAQVNGRIVDAVFIDQPISDSILVVWKGITLADLKIFDKSIKRSGEERKKKD